MAKAIMGAAMIAGAIALDVVTAGAATPFEIALMSSLATGGISMEAGAIANALTSNRGTGITIRQPAAYRQLVRGIRRVGGVLVYCSTTGSQHDQYNAVIVLTGHEVDAIENMYIDGRQVYWQGSGPGWSVRNGTGFGGIADGGDHVGPGGAIYNFGGTGHSGLYVEARYGDQLPGDVIGALTANDGNWVADGHGNSPYLGGCCYVYVKLEYNSSLFPGGPASAELKFTVRGKNDIYDPRSGAYGYTSNWALHIADLLTDPVWGLGDIDGVDQTQLIAAANICDETVPLANGNSELRYALHWMYDSSVSPGDALGNLMAAAGGRLSRIGGSWFIWPAYWQGPSFDFDASAMTGPIEWNPYRALRERWNRVNGTYIAANVPYNDAGNLYDSNGWYNGTILNNWPFGFQPTSFPQYACDPLHGYTADTFLMNDSGVKGAYDGTLTYDVDDVVTKAGIIYRSLIAANLSNDPAAHSVSGGSAVAWDAGTTYAAGTLVGRSGNRYISLAAANTGNDPLPIQFTANTTSGSNVLASPSITTGLQVGLAISGVGIPSGATIATLTPTLTLSAAATATATAVALTVAPSGTWWAVVAWLAWSNQLPLELDLNCVLSVAQAQRLAKIALLRNRQEGSGTFPLHLTCWQMQPLDLFTQEFPDYNWTGKQLEVISTRFYTEQQDKVQVVRFEATAQEADPSVYEWSTTEELSVYDVPSNPAQMPYNIVPPTGVALLSNSGTALLGADGVNHPRILVTWTDPADVRVVQVQVQYQVVGAGSFTDAGAIAIGTQQAYVGNVISGISYNVQLRSIAANGATSAWVAVGPLTANGPNSLTAGYSNTPAISLSNPTSTTITVAATAVTFGAAPAVNYAARTLTIPAPGTPTWYYVTIADTAQAGESGTPTLTATASTSNALVGVQGNTYMGAVLCLPAGSGVRQMPGGNPAPYTSQVGV